MDIVSSISKRHGMLGDVKFMDACQSCPAGTHAADSLSVAWLDSLSCLEVHRLEHAWGAVLLLEADE